MSELIKVKDLTLGSTKYILTGKQHILNIGIELEGYWHDGHEELKGDSSVEGFNSGYNQCEGNCRDNCECYSYCDCNSCQLCSECEESLDECSCESCLKCNDCNNGYSDCECEIEKICDKLENECNVMDRCNFCVESFQELQDVMYDCRYFSNTQNNCELDCCCDCQCECDCESNNEVGEVASPKLKVNEAKDWILNNYPDEHNSTCGLHIHLSFVNDKKDYQIISTKRFYDHFMKEIRQWSIDRNINDNSRFIKRLNGVKYSLDEFHADQQIISESDTRYTHLNYCYNKFTDNNSEFGTVEIRVGTVFDDPNLSVEYVHKVIQIFNEYLDNHKPNKFKYSKYVKLNNAYNFTLHLDIEQKEKGIEIYVKSDRFNKLYDCDQNDLKEIEVNNYKMTFFNSMINHIDQSENFESLKVYNSEKNLFLPNLNFLKMKGLKNGQKFFIKGLYTEKHIDNYLNLIDDNLEYFVKEFC